MRDSLFSEETSVLLCYFYVIRNWCNCMNAEKLRMTKISLSLKPTINTWLVH